MEKKANYVARVVGRLDNRYYLIEVHNRLYVIDYFNPKDIRNYLWRFNAYNNTEYLIYDVTEQVEQYELKPFNIWLENFRKVFDIVSIALVFWLLFFPPKFANNPMIFSSWRIILILFFIGALLIFLVLNLGMDKTLKFNFQDALLLRATIKENKKGSNSSFFKVIQHLITFILLFSGCLFIGIFNSNYLTLLLFTFIGGYSILFIYAISIQYNLNRFKFHIIKNKQEA